MSSPMPGSSETGEIGEKSATAGNRAHTSCKSRSSRLSRAIWADCRSRAPWVRWARSERAEKGR